MRYDDLTNPGESEPVRPTTGLTFRCARTIEEVQAAWHLTYVSGRRRQAIAANRHQLHAPSSAVGPQSVVLIGQIGPVIVSTLTATVENTLGLPADQTFGSELRGLRRPGRTIMELHLFADRRADDERSVDALMHLLALGWSWGDMHGATDCLIAIEPARVEFFRIAFGFEPVGEPRLSAGSVSAQVVMHGEKAQTTHATAGMRFLQQNLAPPSAFKDRYRFDLNDVVCSTLGTYLHDKHPIRTAG
jgi:hypothetical protein